MRNWLALQQNMEVRKVRRFGRMTSQDFPAMGKKFPADFFPTTGNFLGSARAGAEDQSRIPQPGWAVASESVKLKWALRRAGEETSRCAEK
jgi:hypothetical protein